MGNTTVKRDVIIVPRDVTQVSIRRDGNVYTAEWHASNLRTDAFPRYTWHDVTVTDDGWEGPRTVSVREDAIVPKCECGNAFRLCHPDA